MSYIQLQQSRSRRDHRDVREQTSSYPKERRQIAIWSNSKVEKLLIDEDEKMKKMIQAYK